jgi:hypothetical protein
LIDKIRSWIMKWRTSLTVALVAVALLSSSGTGQDTTRTSEARRIALEDELRVLLKDHGPTHPDVINLKERIALLVADAGRSREINPNGLLIVLTRNKVAATLKHARIQSLANRAFVVGVEVEGPQTIKPTFIGKTMWVPLDEVTQLVEWNEATGTEEGGTPGPR